MNAAVTLEAGIAACRSGDYAKARHLLETALQAEPRVVAGWAALGQACVRLGDASAAGQALQRALALDPASSALRLNWAAVLRTQGDNAGAREALQALLHAEPGHALAHYNLGNLLRDEGETDTAEQHFLTAIRLAPALVEAHYNLACLWRDRGDVTAARGGFQRVLALSPRHADACHNLAGCHRALGDWDAARAGYSTALVLSDSALSRYALGTLDLLQGRWADGWDGYEARWAACGIAEPDIALPRWRGEAVAASARLLIVAEQGFGDVLQFARFVPGLRARFAAVTLVCPTPLLRLLATSLGDAVTVLDAIPIASGYSHWIPIMSLAGVLGIDESRLANYAAPYLQSSQPARQFAAGERHVGLCWTGSPSQLDNARRTVPLGLLRQLAPLPLRWHNLQQGQGEAARAAGFDLVDESADWADFDATAAYVAGLDLVLTSCTSVAHLAGALGKPVWLMSRFDADWRWLLARDDSPWYPTLRLFRQPRPGDWPAVVEAVRMALLTL
ncbi:tetratricopeptide repeat protein [Chitinolyticbacter meiyuanensis]|uniref:tetratricopeptide repeat protein n=1 Tax=Chitinolyticbacter meiyuanensis TaxID=682798 RepID=UPI001651EECA|nr:tetratricopeptide repeat protein [Chitinolyticbacter meiyuanensis]